jgi:hypothetical protein
VSIHENTVEHSLHVHFMCSDCCCRCSTMYSGPAEHMGMVGIRPNHYFQKSTHCFLKSTLNFPKNIFQRPVWYFFTGSLTSISTFKSNANWQYDEIFLFVFKKLSQLILKMFRWPYVCTISCYSAARLRSIYFLLDSRH